MSPIVLTLWLAAADDEPATLFGREVVRVAPLSEDERQARRAGFEQMLDERGWVQIGDQVAPRGASGDFAQPPAPQADWTFPPHRSTIFLNFFGSEALTNGTYSALDESACVQGTMPWPGFGGTEQQALALIDVFETQMAPYGVRIAYAERPPDHLPFAMVMMGGSPDLLGLGGGVLGVSCSSDCGDRWWRDTTFAFTDNINPNNAEVLGTTALHEAAHAFGLAHIADPSKIMNPFVGSGNVTWADTCTPYDDATGGINCQPTHDEFCDGGAQNSAAELLAYFGENSPDLEPPFVEILSPADGAEFAPGESIMVEADISDNHEGVGWKLAIPEIEAEDVAFTFQKAWPLSLPAGTYTIRIEAIDHDRNETVAEVTVYVGMDAPVDPADTSGGVSGGVSGDGGMTDDTSNDDGGESTDGGLGQDDDGAEGCACAADGPVAPSAAGLLFVGALAVRRRRSH